MCLSLFNYCLSAQTVLSPIWNSPIRPACPLLSVLGNRLRSIRCQYARRRNKRGTAGMVGEVIEIRENSIHSCFAKDDPSAIDPEIPEEAASLSLLASDRRRIRDGRKLPNFFLFLHRPLLQTSRLKSPMSRDWELCRPFGKRARRGLPSRRMRFVAPWRSPAKRRT